MRWWKEIDYRYRLVSNDPKLGLASVNEFYDSWKIFVYPYDNDYDLTETNNSGIEVRSWIFEFPCTCLKDQNYRKRLREIDIRINRIVAWCQSCDEPRIRIHGFATLDWSLWIHKDLVKGVTR